MISNGDPSAIHWSHPNEINTQLAAKATPVDADVVVIEDSEDSWAKKKVALSSIGTGGGGSSNASYSETVGDTTTTTFNITHSLNSSAVAVEVIEVSSGDGLVAGTDYTWSVTDNDTIQVVFASAPGTDDARVVVLSDGGTGGSGGGMVWAEAVAPDNAPGGAEDDEFTGTSIDGAWTQVTVSGTADWAQGGDLLQVFYSGQSSGDAAAILKSIPGTPTAPISIATAIRTTYAGTSLVGLVFTDGATASSNCVMLRRNYNDNTLQAFSGTLTNLQGSLLAAPISNSALSAPVIHIKLTWSGTNSWLPEVSLNGVNWVTLVSPVSATLTPTHYGVFVSRWGVSGSMLTGFEYFRVG